MYSESGQHIIQSFRKKWVLNVIISLALIAIAWASTLAILLYKIASISLLFMLPLFVVILIALLLLRRPRKVNDKDVVSFLNSHYPQLEESCGLLLKPVEELNLLENLQAQKTLATLQHITPPAEFAKPLRTGLLTVLLLGIVGFGLAIVPFNFNASSNKSVTNKIAYTIEKVLPGISSATITITSPPYTKQPVKRQKQFNLRAEEGSLVQWNIQTSAAVSSIKLLFNDSTSLSLKPGNTNTLWQTSKKLVTSGFYQVMLDNTLSEFYKIEVVKDQPPVINITSPKPNITIEYGEPQRITINASVTDDYGIKNATIIATTASGSGEAVKFKEQEIRFANSFGGQLTNYPLTKLVDLAALGMQPADELYFYIKAIDNNNQEKRSDIYIITLADTAQLMETDVLIGNIKLKPEFFRSERQIIIETEQLLKDKDTISITDFKNRSNNLGIDQKLLRLRYGKFLGEEGDQTEGGDANSNALSDPQNFGNASAILDAFSDKHDNAEDATFFTDDIKQQLKATLTEMWNAEIRLRTFKPQEALPYEYKALRLLKDLQQKSRVYVAKTSFKTPPLKPEKRLTGDLSKIIQPETQAIITQPISPAQTIATALGILEHLKFSTSVTNHDGEYLQQAMQLLSNKAAAEPALYLAGFQSLKIVTEALQNKSEIPIKHIQSAENALQKMSAGLAQLPVKNNALPYNQLQQQYFNNLQKTKHK